MTYALATIRTDSGAVPAIEVDGDYFALPEVAPELIEPVPSRGIMALFDDWSASDAKLEVLAGRIRGTTRGKLLTPRPFDFMSPVPDPPKLLLGGANYYHHIRVEAGKPDFTKETGTPVFFMKAPGTALVGSGAVRYPAQSQKFDWEIELAVIVGSRLRRASEQQAEAAIAGYAVGIDFSARDWQFNPAHPYKFDLFTGKAFDDSCPVGPRFVPARFVDVGRLGLRLWVNGELMQDANTDDMVWTPAEQLAAISQHTTVEPGDILLTGTPSGVGLARGFYLKIGDAVDAEIDGLGRLQTRIVADADERPIL